ncbi:hypothetical protein [Hyphomicrobium sp. 2TAF46]|uniref:hypothetical protein n=1 Tax=Hyphomicrobium sp. 2TAF46 TaxID=3233019 RepID=UPI003F8F2338
MRPRIKARFEPWEAALKLFERPLAAAGKARLFPNFVKPPRIAGIAPLKVHGADPKPTRDPDVDGVVLGQGATCDVRWWLVKERNGHENATLLKLGHATCLTPDAIRD